MASKDYMSDDYVADLLKRDARHSASRYSALGLEALLPKRPTLSAPKPNTRFLQNILRETDTHNAALKDKEREDAARRLRRMRRDIVEDRRHDHRRAREHSIDRHRSKRRRLKRPDEDQGRLSRETSACGSRGRSRGHEKNSRIYRQGKTREACEDDDEIRDEDEDDRKRHRRRRTDRDGGRSREERAERLRSRSPHGHSQSHRNDADRKHYWRRSPELDADQTPEQARRCRSRPGDPQAPSERRTHYRDSAESKKAYSAMNKSQRSPMIAKDKDSDPLEATIGPAPPSPPPRVRPRGRGALATSSGIESRFAASYNPSADVQLDDSIDDDWDMALEALRDRQHWKQKGADRLRAAGFTKEEVDKWENGTEKKEEDVVWKKKGEGREWDRGKVIDTEGQVVLEPPEWGRLKGT
ncbi:MAG: hypothetical protein LQ340_000107 [Diploschistes diacapsis]|nr:MAG: hypothetical protein LQ340_000107 [Diploschistes diacapsis]